MNMRHRMMRNTKKGQDGLRFGIQEEDKEQKENEIQKIKGRADVPSPSARNMKVRREVTTSNLLSPNPRTCLMALARIKPLEYIS